jgi:hypothetical protein
MHRMQTCTKPCYQMYIIDLNKMSPALQRMHFGNLIQVFNIKFAFLLNHIKIKN